MKIAIIGTGISGLGAAYLLRQKHEVTVYEKDARAGGHSRTLEVAGTPVDTGFIVFNKKNYPHLTGMFRHLGVEIIKSDMSFGASIENGYIEYGSKGMFAQKTNLLRPQFLGMIADILRFNARANRYLQSDMTLGECLDDMNLGDWFRRYYLQAMGAAIWSCSVETILAFPASSFIRFFDNHGLLTVNSHPQWYTVAGGSRTYVAKLTQILEGRIRYGCGATEIQRQDNGIAVRDTRGDTMLYDHVVFACHADQALHILKDADAQEREILSAFTYQKNTAILHGDQSFMPRRRKAWASWIYLSEKQADDNPSVSLTYWMNNLQSLPASQPLFVTLNPGRRPAQNLIYDEHVFEHPVFTKAAVAAQTRIAAIQEKNRVSFCGAHLRYGFHEDGLLSAVRAATALGADIPWL
ncbi:MAG: FAD-dependent oxidoreductase [Proteobacteria bacterium]|nr:FAD-dependent oxidoreductase [Pseudomonadota bacterium]